MKVRASARKLCEHCRVARNKKRKKLYIRCSKYKKHNTRQGATK